MTETLSCIKCGHDQAGGNFCEVCGERFPEPLLAEPPASTAMPASASGATASIDTAATTVYAMPPAAVEPTPGPTSAQASAPAAAPSPIAAAAPAPVSPPRPASAVPPPPPAQAHPPYVEPQYTTPQYAAPQYTAPQYGDSHYQAPPAGGPGGPPNYAVPPAVPPRVPRDDVWSGLFDSSFHQFPTPGLVRLAWIVGVAWIALSLIVAIWVISDNWGGGLSVFLLLKSIAVAVFALAAIRLALEVALAIFRIREKKE